jgi:Xaa-Pro dipeptidase
VTIEPGIYFIDMLLDEARAGAHRNAIDWDRVAALAPCGGVRIEDDVVAREGTPENITRAAFEQAAA